jgi:hypothetical protein
VCTRLSYYDILGQPLNSDVHIDTLLAQVKRNMNKPITINKLYIHYSYDVMSSLAFGAPAKFLKGESSEFANKVSSEIQWRIRMVGLLIHIPWVLKTN